LAYTAMIHQSPFMQRYEGKHWDEPSGQDKLGSGPLHRAYRARDGWFFLGARPDEVTRFAAAEGLSDLVSLRGEALEQALEQRLAGATVDTWVTRLTRAGIGAHHYVGALEELMADPWVTAHELSLTRAHEGMGLVTTCGPAPRLSRTPIRVGLPASKPGSDAYEVLSDIGLTDREIGALIEAGVVRVDGVKAG
jgi:crotonobetainyl-CoA:carnitine CoA-transferase CaiB-like acyl-CoA transferase